MVTSVSSTSTDSSFFARVFLVPFAAAAAFLGRPRFDAVVTTLSSISAGISRVDGPSVRKVPMPVD
jgi:hypothetical protein